MTSEVTICRNLLFFSICCISEDWHGRLNASYQSAINPAKKKS
jgi:hypothetical protein